MQASFLTVVSAYVLVSVPALTLDESSSKEFPVSKVVKILEDMKATLQKEADTDEEVYDKLACWCETNDKAKSKAITDAETRISDLTSEILKFTAQGEQLKVEIASVEKEIAENKESLATATALREKQAAEFTQEEKEMVESIKALDAAIVVLSKHHDVNGTALLSVMATASAQMQKHGDLLLGSITPREKRVIMSFAQRQPDYLDATPTFKQAYKPQSGEIFGILRQMKETFESDLSQDQREEISARETYEALKKAKEAEISTAQGVLEQKTELAATTGLNLVQAKEDRDDTTASLSADEKFLMKLKTKCSETDQEWEQRQKTRLEELNAVTQAISILSSDDARDLFSKTFNPSLANTSFSLPSAFLQEISVKEEQARQRAADTLRLAAAKHRNPKLTALSVQVRLDAFTQVKKAIDDMVRDLLKEKDDEIKHKAYCVDELAKNDRGTALETHSKGNTEMKISALTAKIGKLEDEIKALNDEIKGLDDAMDKAKVNREAENAEFKSVVTDQQQTQVLLQQALKVLEDVYKTALFLQRQQHGTSASFAPPPDFSEYKKSGNAPPVMALMQHILYNVQQMEQEALTAEAKSQDAYTAFKQTSMEAKQAKNDSIIDKTKIKAETEQLRTEANTELGTIKDELSNLGSEKGTLHSQCDYTLNNFDVRQEARDQEVEALRQAKAYLSGMSVE